MIQVTSKRPTIIILKHIKSAMHFYIELLPYPLNINILINKFICKNLTGNEQKY